MKTWVIAFALISFLYRYTTPKYSFFRLWRSQWSNRLLRRKDRGRQGKIPEQVRILESDTVKQFSDVRGTGPDSIIEAHEKTFVADGKDRNKTPRRVL